MARSRFLRRTAVIMTSTSSLVAVALALVLVGSLALRFVDKPRVVRIAIGPSDTADAKFGEALGRELPHGFGSSRIELVREKTLSEISDSIDEGRAELAIVRSDVAVPKNAGTMLVVHRDAALFLTRPESKIAEIASLEKKKVGIVPGSDANVALLDTLLTHYGIETENVEHVPLAKDAVADALAKKTVDAIMVVYPLGSDNLQKVVTTMADAGEEPPVFLALKDAEALEQGQFGLKKVDVPGGMFAGSPPLPEDELTTVGVDYQLVARLEMSEGAVDVLTRTIFQLRRTLAATAPIALFMQGADTEKGSQFALHPGATSYYQDTEKSFMDRYGDWFYIMAMVAGGLGSAIASLVSSIQTRSRRHAMVIIDQLCALRGEADKSPDPAALQQIDRTVSELALNALLRAREGRFDQPGLEILRLAVEEARRAIAERAAQLAGNGAFAASPPSPPPSPGEITMARAKSG